MEDTITILRGIKEKYEVHHQLNIRDSALISAATLSERYISDRFLPDKAVDLIDEAASKLRMEMNSAPELIDDLNRKLIHYEVEREALKKEKDPKSKERLIKCKKQIVRMRKELDQYVQIWENEKQTVSQISKIKEELENNKFKMENHFRDGNFAAASKIQYDTIPDLEKNIETLTQNLEESQFVKLDVRTNDIAEVVSKWTGIPVQKMLEGEKEKLLNLEAVFRNRVVGQEEALKKLDKALKRNIETQQPKPQLKKEEVVANEPSEAVK